MNGVVHCASPLCADVPRSESRFCEGHLAIFARVRAEIEEEAAQSTTWKKGIRRRPDVRKTPAPVVEELVLAA